MAERKKSKRIFILILFLTLLSIFSILSVYNSKSFTKLLQFSPGSTETDGNGELTRKLPSSIIIGVKKGGTKAIISMLDSHPHITAAKGEVHYFDRDFNYDLGEDWYLKRMPLTSKDTLCIEKSPSYFVVPSVPGRILKLKSDIKLLLVVRDPVTRTISDYAQLDAKKATKNLPRPSFDEFVLTGDGEVKVSRNIIKVSLYDIHFKRWLKSFPIDSILVVNGDELVSDPYSVLIKVEEFLKVPKYFAKEMFYYNETKGFYCWTGSNNSTNCLGSSKGRKHPKVSEETLDKLRNYFRPHIKSFCSMANVSFNWCNL